MHEVIQYKSIGSEQGSIIKDIDEKQGRIIGYFSVFGNVDSDKDMIMPGAYTKTLQENHKRLKHLYQHNPWQPLSGTKDGKLIMKEDGYGLWFDSTISQTSYGRDTIKLYADGVIDEHSIGFKTIRNQPKDNFNELIELKLWEGSTVTWASNELAVTSSVKSINHEHIIIKMDKVLKALRNGKYENEDIFDMLELYLKQLSQIIIDLSTAPSISTDTLQTVISTTPDEKSTLPEECDDELQIKLALDAIRLKMAS